MTQLKKPVKTKRAISRLEQMEDSQAKKQAWIIIALTSIYMVGFLFIGVPLLIKLAIVIADAKAELSSDGPEDTIAPTAPRFANTPEATYSASIDLSGIAEADSVVVLKQDGQPLARANAGESGNFYFSAIDLEVGDNNFSATAIDSAGNESAPSNLIKVQHDIVAPKLTITAPEEGQLFIGSTEQQVSILGNADDASRVEIDGNSIVLSREGDFVYRTKLSEGSNSFTFTAYDAAGNSSQASISLSYTP